MKIHFCDLCNESVPEGDLAAGKAFRRGGRIVCGTCDALMSGRPAGSEPDATRLSAGVGPGTGPERREPRPAPPPPVTASAAAAPAPSGGRASGWIGALALVVAAGVAFHLGGEVERLGEQSARLDRELDERARALAADVDAFSQGAMRRGQELEDRVALGFEEQRRERALELERLREELDAAREAAERAGAELARIEAREREAGADAERRLDELAAQGLRVRGRVDELADRLERAEEGLAQRPAVAPAAAPREAAGPAWAAELADLQSEVAGTRWNAVQSLGETGDLAVVPHLVPLLDDPDVFVRMAVARVFGDLGAAAAIEPLIDTLEDEEPVVREAAMAALHLVTGRDFRFDPNAGPAERGKRVQAWRDWWKGARAGYLGDA
jgi:hypothetical protein